MTVRAVFLDFGGTLVSSWVSEGRDPAEFWQAILEGHGISVDAAALREALGRTAEEFEGRIYGFVGRTAEFWRAFDGRVLDRLGIAEGRARLFKEVDRTIHEASRGTLYPDVVPALEALSARGLLLGVVSNHNDALRDYLAFHGIDRFFRTVTYSQEAGAEKPDRRVFDLALARTGCAPDEVVHVGDSWEGDYLGARAVGLRAVWLNRRGDDPPGPCEEVRDLHGLPRLLNERP